MLHAPRLGAYPRLRNAARACGGASRVISSPPAARARPGSPASTVASLNTSATNPLTVSSTLEWAGLAPWRAKGVSRLWHWGKNGPCEGSSADTNLPDVSGLPDTLSACGDLVLRTASPLAKAALTHSAFSALSAGRFEIGSAAAPEAPSRPVKPQLVPPKEVPTVVEWPHVPSEVHMLHNLAHIELNAIDLAWDTVVRFSHLHPAVPSAFFSDFARVADDEARHLGWCLQRLRELGHAYGDIPAHNRLWDSAQSTAGDLADRLVIVPCVQEARGLDAGARLVDRLNSLGDKRSAAIVRQIAEEEKAHVAVGVAWLRALCHGEQRDPAVVFRDAVAKHIPDGLKGPFNDKDRVEVGLEAAWYHPTGSTVQIDTTKPKRRRGDFTRRLREQAAEAAAGAGAASASLSSSGGATHAAAAAGGATNRTGGGGGGRGKTPEEIIEAARRRSGGSRQSPADFVALQQRLAKIIAAEEGSAAA